MSSNDASPLNPYALAGIAGEAADRWAALGYSAERAAPWARFAPDDGALWDEMGWTSQEATEWYEIEATPHEAEEAIHLGAEPSDLVEASAIGIYLDDYLAMAGAVRDGDEMVAWLGAIEDKELVEPVDVAYLVKAGLAPEDLYQAPDHLTAGETVAYLADEADADVFGSDEDFKGDAVYGSPLDQPVDDEDTDLWY